MSEPLQDEGRITPHGTTTNAAKAPRALVIRFTGSGSEYFRLWIVNLLLTLVTVGLYFPFAKARRLSYFYSNTVVDGQALAFHGNPWKMLRGFLLLAVLAIAYGGAGHISPTAGLIAFVLLALAWPALWRASLQFRMGNTSWRGLRFGFKGDLAGAYRAVAPIYLPAVVMVAAPLLLAPDVAAGPPGTLSTTQAWLLFGPLAVLYLLLPWSLCLIKRYQHGGYAYAAQQTSLKTSTGAFYKLGLKAFVISVLLIVALGGLGTGAVALFRTKGEPLSMAAVYGSLALAYLLYFAFIAPYFTARMQDIVWNGTRSEAIRFGSQLPVGKLASLTLKNWLLTAATLSLYRPFAVVDTTRMRLAAMTISVEGDLDAWISRAAGDASPNAAGDAAGDFFGIDMGL